MKPREKIIAGILAVLVLIWISGRRESNGPAKTALPAAASPVSPNAPATPEQEMLPVSKILQIVGQTVDVVTNAEICDPFVRTDPALAKGNEPLAFSDLILTGIVRLENAEPMALINGQVLQQTEKIGDFEIHEIRENEVEVVKGLEKNTLLLFNLTGY